MSFYLQDILGGKALTSANTLATSQVILTALDCRGTIFADPNPVQVCDATGKGQTTIRRSSIEVQRVEVHINRPNGVVFGSSGPGSFSASTGKWVDQGMIFYLQGVSGGLALTEANTIAIVTTSTTSLGCRGRIGANRNPIPVCDGSGTVQTLIAWNASAASSVEVHLNSPGGPLVAASGGGAGSASTGKWVKDGTAFYLQDVSSGLLIPTNTIGRGHRETDTIRLPARVGMFRSLEVDQPRRGPDEASTRQRHTDHVGSHMGPISRDMAARTQRQPEL